MQKGTLRFFFDYGCLWAGDDATRDGLGVGPMDAAIYGLDGTLKEPARIQFSQATQELKDDLIHMCTGYINPIYPGYPSLWSQALCDRFNARVDELLRLMNAEIGDEYVILDEQTRFMEDPDLDAYLLENPELKKLDELTPDSFFPVSGLS